MDNIPVNLVRSGDAMCISEQYKEKEIREKESFRNFVDYLDSLKLSYSLSVIDRA